MIATINEVEQWCLRAMAGSGAPAGIDDEAATATAWLAARGFSAVDALVSTLDRWADDPTAATIGEGRRENTTRHLDAAGRSGAFLGGALIDLAVADSVRGEAPGEIRAANLTDPLFLLPAAERYRRGGCTFELFWRSTAGQSEAGAILDRAGPSLFGCIAGLREARPVALSITCAQQSDALGDGVESASLAPLLRANDLDRRYERALETGIAVNDQIWARLKDYGMRALVPASARSRARGAGAAGSDNE